MYCVLCIEEPWRWKGFREHLFQPLPLQTKKQIEGRWKTLRKGTDITVAKATEPRVHSTGNSLEAIWKPPVLGMTQVLIKCL